MCLSSATLRKITRFCFLELVVLIYLCSYVSLDFKGRGEKESTEVGEDIRGCKLAGMVEQLKEPPTEN